MRQLIKRHDPQAMSAEELKASHDAYLELGVIVARAVTGYATHKPIFERDSNAPR